MSTLRKRLDSVEERIEFKQWAQLARQSQGRPELEMRFFVVHGFWPEGCGNKLPPGMEFTVRGIKQPLPPNGKTRIRRNERGPTLPPSIARRRSGSS
jgi:hypothetical protein